jgi:hypothetical protein
MDGLKSGIETLYLRGPAALTLEAVGPRVALPAVP